MPSAGSHVQVRALADPRRGIVVPRDGALLRPRHGRDRRLARVPGRRARGMRRVGTERIDGGGRDARGGFKRADAPFEGQARVTSGGRSSAVIGTSPGRLSAGLDGRPEKGRENDQAQGAGDPHGSRLPSMRPQLPNSRNPHPTIHNASRATFPGEAGRRPAPDARRAHAPRPLSKAPRGVAPVRGRRQAALRRRNPPRPRRTEIPAPAIASRAIDDGSGTTALNACWAMISWTAVVGWTLSQNM
jgi:hypothetical protein